MERFNSACNYISKIAFKTKTFGKIKLQKLVYYDVREKYGLSSQMVVRAIGKVSESYKTDKKTLHKFKPHGAIIYDERILTIKTPDTISILTINGRIKLPIKFGNYLPLENKRVRGQADLIYKNGEFYLMLVVDIPEEPPNSSFSNVLGVDLGIVNLATTNDGIKYSGEKCTKVRKRYERLRAELQKKNTWSAKRKLKKISGRERRFKRDVNHCISKQIVLTAKGTNRAIALEDLKGIRNGGTVNKAVRKLIDRWAFYELAQFIQYKAKLYGVPVFFVNPRYTSQTCSNCGYVSKNNRKSQSVFVCKKCGFSENADVNAALNIAHRAEQYYLGLSCQPA
jgi:IS605 OrfB family transposase